MKKLVLLGLLLLSTITYSQYKLTNVSRNKYVYFQGGVDVRNAIVGSEPTNDEPALDLNVQLGIIGEKGWGFGVGGEVFDAIGYYSWNIRFNKEFYLFSNKVSIIPSIDLGQIFRKYDVTYPTNIYLYDVIDNGNGTITANGNEVYLHKEWEYYESHDVYVGVDKYGHEPMIETTENYEYWLVAVNTDIKYNLNDRHSLGVNLNLTKRADLEDRYPEDGNFQVKYSVFATYTYKIPLE